MIFYIGSCSHWRNTALFVYWLDHFFFQYCTRHLCTIVYSTPVHCSLDFVMFGICNQSWKYLVIEYSAHLNVAVVVALEKKSWSEVLPSCRERLGSGSRARAAPGEHRAGGPRQLYSTRQVHSTLDPGPWDRGPPLFPTLRLLQDCAQIVPHRATSRYF